MWYYENVYVNVTWDHQLYVVILWNCLCKRYMRASTISVMLWNWLCKCYMGASTIFDMGYNCWCECYMSINYLWCDINVYVNVTWEQHQLFLIWALIVDVNVTWEHQLTVMWVNCLCKCYIASSSICYIRKLFFFVFCKLYMTASISDAR
jgi:hypothetical protein